MHGMILQVKRYPTYQFKWRLMALQAVGHFLSKLNIEIIFNEIFFGEAGFMVTSIGSKLD